jgi:2-polyprenyl-6-methoxyphenol hydroxylase-like FAD-dependent oxidoreductase
MEAKRVLISGAGIAGPVLAYWLTKHNIQATIIERAPSLRNTGQSVEVAGPSLKVVQKMGLEAKIGELGTHEAGLSFVDERDHAFAKLPIVDSGVTFTSEYEILRGLMVGIFYETTRAETEYVFGDYITSVEDDGSKVTVGFKKGATREFDVLVIADGTNSSTRSLVFPPAPTVSLGGHCCAFFSIPWTARDADWGRFYTTPGLQILLRPHGPSGTAAHLGVYGKDTEGLMQLPVKARKERLHQIFASAGWEAPRVLAGMDIAEDFYMTEITQVKMKKFHQGRVVLLGDSAWCPSPWSGQGTTLSIVGAYVLAGELATHKSVEDAFQSYKALMLPYVEKCQSLPPGIPGLVLPQTAWGVWCFRTFMWFIIKTGIVGLIGTIFAFFDIGQIKFDVPDYGL